MPMLGESGDPHSRPRVEPSQPGGRSLREGMNELEPRLAAPAARLARRWLCVCPAPGRALNCSLAARAPLGRRSACSAAFAWLAAEGEVSACLGSASLAPAWPVARTASEDAPREASAAAAAGRLGPLPGRREAASRPGRPPGAAGAAGEAAGAGERGAGRAADGRRQAGAQQGAAPRSHPERPEGATGFYDLSDGGSCSLSNSCTSVFSESVSSSHASLLPSSQHPKTRLSIFDYRPKSADETTVHNQFQQQGAYISDECRIKACPDVSGTPTRSRPRPVSTGDLERLTLADAGYPKVTDPKSFPLLSPGGEIQFFCVDPKYQSDLVSKSGNEVYPYPSPLHAVALQSPLFSLAGPPSEKEAHPLPNKVAPHTVGPSLIRTLPVAESRPGGYINKLLQLTRSRGNNQADAGERCPTKSQPFTMLQRLIIIPSPGGVKINSSGSQMEKQGSSLHGNKAEGKLRRGMPEGECAKQQGTQHSANVEQAAALAHAESPLAVNGCYSASSSARDSPLTEAGESSLERSSSSSQLGTEDSSLSPTNTNVAPTKKSHKKPVKAGGRDLVPQGGFVHAKFVPAESHQVRVRFANSKMKPVKVKRRSSEKVPRPGKQAFFVEKPRGLHHVAARLPVEWSLAQRQLRGRNLMRRPTFAGEATGRSCSESSLYPVPFRLPQVPSGPELYQANALYSLEAAYIDTTNKKKQRKWQSTVEISTENPSGQPFERLCLGATKAGGAESGDYALCHNEGPFQEPPPLSPWCICQK
uniref:Dishevelled binding antagonist of beta catenin 2 n=1 Tax=Podarcis muralis TaxID=64176 RepID=A0A670I6W8_PODMU